jgi:hypothetical protein
MASAAPSSLRLAPADLTALARAAFWARLIAVLGLIWCGLVALVAVVIVLIPRSIPGMGRIPIALAVIVGTALAVAYLRLLLRYAAGLRAHAAGDTGALAGAFRALKTFWICTVLFYVLSTVASVAMTILQLLGRGNVPGS